MKRAAATQQDTSCSRSEQRDRLGSCCSDTMAHLSSWTPTWPENASDTEPARLLAVLIVDAAEKQLVIPDPESKN